MQSNSTEIWNSSTEKALTSGVESQLKLGQLVTSLEADPTMHLSWKLRPVNWSRFPLAPKELAHDQPSKLNPP